MTLTVGKKIEVDIIDLDYKGDGVAKIDDQIIFIPNTLVGEKAEIEIKKIKKNIIEAVLIKRITSANFRTQEKSNLGSLDLAHLTFEKQLEWQKDLTSKTLEKVLRKEVTVEDTITDHNPTHYRNKVVFHILEKATLTLGLYQKDPIKLTKVDDFILAMPFVNKLIKALNDAKLTIDYKVFKHIVFKNNQKNEYMVTLVSYKKYFKGLEHLIEFLGQFPEVIGITLNIKPRENIILGNKTYYLYGEKVLKENQFYITDQTFFQTNYKVMEMTYDLIKKHLKGPKVIDAYSGIGSIGYSLIDHAKHITMIESHSENIKIAEQIKEENNYKNVDIYHGKAEEVLKKFDAETLVLDPPRQGLLTEVVDKILKYQFKQVIYLSCSLQSLARDLRLLDEAYEIKVVYPIKMFPQTTSIETLVILEKK